MGTDWHIALRTNQFRYSGFLSIWVLGLSCLLGFGRSRQTPQTQNFTWDLTVLENLTVLEDQGADQRFLHPVLPSPDAVRYGLGV